MSIQVLSPLNFFCFWPCGVFVAAWPLSTCGEQGFSLVAVHELLIAVAFVTAEHGL